MEPSDTKMDRVLYFVRWIRRAHRKPYEIPIREMIVVHPDAEFLQYVDGQYREFLLEEVNVGSLKTSKDILKYAHYQAVPFTPLIERLGESLAADLVKSMSQDDILSLRKAGEITIASHRLTQKEILVYFECLDENDKSLEQVLSSQESYIRKAIGCPLLPCSLMPSDAVILPGCEVKFTTLTNKKSISIKLTRRLITAADFNSETWQDPNWFHN